MNEIKIVSKGTPATTKVIQVKDDGTEQDITGNAFSVEWSVAIDDVAKAHIGVHPASIEVHLNEDPKYIYKQEDLKIFFNTELFDQKYDPETRTLHFIQNNLIEYDTEIRDVTDEIVDKWRRFECVKVPKRMLKEFKEKYSQGEVEFEARYEKEIVGCEVFESHPGDETFAYDFGATLVELPIFPVGYNYTPIGMVACEEMGVSPTSKRWKLKALTKEQTGIVMKALDDFGAIPGSWFYCKWIYKKEE